MPSLAEIESMALDEQLRCKILKDAFNNRPDLVDDDWRILCSDRFPNHADMYGGTLWGNIKLWCKRTFTGVY